MIYFLAFLRRFGAAFFLVAFFFVAFLAALRFFAMLFLLIWLVIRLLLPVWIQLSFER